MFATDFGELNMASIFGTVIQEYIIYIFVVKTRFFKTDNILFRRK